MSENEFPVRVTSECNSWGPETQTYIYFSCLSCKYRLFYPQCPENDKMFRDCDCLDGKGMEETK